MASCQSSRSVTARAAVTVLLFSVGFACGVCSPEVCQCWCEVHRWMLVNRADKENTVSAV